MSTESKKPKQPQITPAEFLKKVRVEKTDIVTKQEVIADAEDPSATKINLKDAKVYFPDAKVGDNLTFDTLWYFHFPYIEPTADRPEVPTMMGEYGKTAEEATERIRKRLQVFFKTAK